MPDQPWIWRTEQIIPSLTGAGQAVLDEVVAQLQSHTWGQRDVFGVRLAMEEALTNAIRHGNRHDANKRVHVCCQLSADFIRIEIADEGPGFRPEEVPDCTAEENLEVPSGRGIMLMRSFMSRVEYSPDGTLVILEKRRDPHCG